MQARISSKDKTLVISMKGIVYLPARFTLSRGDLLIVTFAVAAQPRTAHQHWRGATVKLHECTDSNRFAVAKENFCNICADRQASASLELARMVTGVFSYVAG